MEFLHHCLELKDTASRVSGIIAVAAFRHIIVERIIAPIVLGNLRMILVYRRKIERRKYMYGIDSKFLKMLNSLILSKAKELSLVYQARSRVNRKVTIV